MPMLPEAQTALDQLRVAGDRRDWNVARHALAAALAYVRAEAVITWLLGPLTAYVPRFEAYQPDETWPRRRMAMLRQYAPDFDRIEAPPWLPEAGQTYDTPGSMYFIQALEKLWRAIISGEPVPYLVDAISAIIMADLVEWWFGARSDDWILWQHAVRLALDVDDVLMMVGSAPHKRAVEVMLRFFDHPATAQRDQAAWHAVAATVERLLIE